MRAAVLYFGDKYGNPLKAMSEAFAEGLRNQGAQVDVIDAASFTSRLSIYQFVAFGTEPAGTFGGKLPEGFKEFMKKSGTLIGTRSFAFILKKGLRPEKSLMALMKLMENEGLFIVSSEVFSKPADSQSMGKTLNIQSKF